MKRMAAFTTVALLALASIANAQSLSSNRIVAKPYELNELRATAPTPEGFEVMRQSWLPLTDNSDGRPYNGGEVFVITAKPGTVSRVLWSIDWIDWENRKFLNDSRMFVIEFEGKKPDDDDDDDPRPTTAPFSSPGFAAMLIREASDTGQMPTAQRQIFTSSKVLRLLNDRCVDAADGRPFYRIWDDDLEGTDLSNVPAAISNAYRDTLAGAKEIPWIAISTGDSGYAGPLPANVDKMIDLIEKWSQ